MPKTHNAKPPDETVGEGSFLTFTILRHRKRPSKARVRFSWLLRILSFRRPGPPVSLLGLAFCLVGAVSEALAREEHESLAVLYSRIEKLQKAPREHQEEIQQARALFDAAEKDLKNAIRRGDISRIRAEIRAGFDFKIRSALSFFEVAVCADRVAIAQMFARPELRIAGRRHDLRHSTWSCVAELGDKRLATMALSFGPKTGWSAEAIEAVVQNGDLSHLANAPHHAVKSALENGKTEFASELLERLGTPTPLTNMISKSARASDLLRLKQLVGLEATSVVLTEEQKSTLSMISCLYGSAEAFELLFEAGFIAQGRDARQLFDEDKAECIVPFVEGGHWDRIESQRVALETSARTTLWALSVDGDGNPPRDSEVIDPKKLAQRLLLGGIDIHIPNLIKEDGTLDVDAEDEAGRTSLIHAAMVKNVGTVMLYLDAGADPNAVDKAGRTAVMIAAREQDADVVMLLRRAGATDDPKARLKASRVFWAPETMRAARIIPDPHSEVLRMAIPKGFSPCSGSEDGLTVSCLYQRLETRLEVSKRRLSLSERILSFVPGKRSRSEISSSLAVKERWSHGFRGVRGAHELTLKVEGPQDLKLELRQLAELVWDTIQIP
ncbi:MAG: ankyrin repeat domain-containing protein [Acidobacteriota bacterium]